MADAPSPITSPPAVPGQPYDATDHGPCGKWQSVDGDATDFESGAGGWKQT